jgi:hypothetical protein
MPAEGNISRHEKGTAHNGTLGGHGGKRMSIAAATQRWNPKAAAEPVAQILTALDAPAVDQATRRELEKIFHRRQYFSGDGAGHLVLLIRTITESEGNADALVAPVVVAVNDAMRPQWTSRGLEWLAAFDCIPLVQILETMRELAIFRESSLGTYLGMSISNRLWKVFGPGELPAPPPAKRCTGRGVRPKGLTDAAWQTLYAKRKARKNELARARYVPKRRPRQPAKVSPIGETFRDQPAAAMAA